VRETFYTLNLGNALRYFSEQLDELHMQEGQAGLEGIYKKLTKRLLFNEYVIRDEFDVFVAFETMNNRGKQLSALELLKNRLIYLTTLYENHELDLADRKSLRDAINEAWKEVYHQLGRNKAEPLNDDEFLQQYSTMYFGYSQRTNYVDFLLNGNSPRRRCTRRSSARSRSRFPGKDRQRPTSRTWTPKTGTLSKKCPRSWPRLGYRRQRYAASWTTCKNPWAIGSTLSTRTWRRACLMRSGGGWSG
jgi:hypothetical protein